MTFQTAAAPETRSLWSQVIRNIPIDPAAIFVYLILIGFVYMIWRNTTRD